MKSRLLALLFVTFCFAGHALHAAEPEKSKPAAESKPGVKDELMAVIGKVREKASAGASKEADYAEELKEFDRILAAHKDEKTDDAAQVLVMKGVLYLQILNDFDKAAATFRQLKADFPDSVQAKEVDEMLKVIAIQQEAQRIQDSLKPGVPFPDFNEKDIEGNPLSVGKFKNNVVLVDFWATWCAPCVEGMPNVVALYNKYHVRGLEIVGVNMDKDEAEFKKFLADGKITWPQYFDGKFWDNKLAGQYGVTQLPFNILVDGNGRIVGKNLNGAELVAALEKLLGP